MADDKKGPLKVSCPTCGKRVEYRGPAANPHFPFCSERCKLVDLGKWLDEEHRIEEPLADRMQRGDKPEEGTGEAR